MANFLLLSCRYSTEHKRTTHQPFAPKFDFVAMTFRTCADVIQPCPIEPATFSSPEAALLLVSTKNRDLWLSPTPEVRDSRTSRHSAHVQSQV